MNLFTTFGDSGLATSFDPEMFASLLARLAVSVGTLFLAGLAFFVILFGVFVFSIQKAISTQSLTFTLRYFLRSLFFLLLFIITLSFSTVAWLFIQTLVWWKALGFGLVIAAVISLMVVSAVRLVAVKFLVRIGVARRVADFLHRLSLLVDSAIRKG